MNEKSEKFVPFYTRLKPHQFKFLKRWSKKTGDPCSQFIRDSLDRSIEMENKKSKEEIMDYN